MFPLARHLLPLTSLPSLSSVAHHQSHDGLRVAASGAMALVLSAAGGRASLGDIETVFLSGATCSRRRGCGNLTVPER